MSRKRHHGNRPTAADYQQLARQAEQAADRLPKIHNLSTFDHSVPSAARGWIPFFSRDTQRELTGYHLERNRNDSRWAYANIGLAARIIDGLASHIGWLMPQPCTSDSDWNARALDRFRSTCLNPGIFDRAGKWDWRLWQLGNNVSRFKDGDLLTVLGETPTGIARVIVYEAHQIRSGSKDTGESPSYRDGVVMDAFGRHLAYDLLDNEFSDKSYRVSSNDAILFADFKRHGQCRGYPVLGGALNHIQDRSEIWFNWKKNIKDSSEVSFYKKRDLPAMNNPAMGLFSGVQSTVVGTDENGNDVVQNVEKLRNNGPGIPNLRVGESLETIHDSRPAPSQQDLVNDLVRDIAWHTGVAPEILWNLAGQTGPSVRFLMADFRRWIEKEQLRLQLIAHRFWVYFVAKEIKNGRLDLPGDEAWWKCAFLPQSDITIDVGREGKLELDQLRHGATTLQDIYHNNGADAKVKLFQSIDLMAEIRDYAKTKGFEGGLTEVMPGFFQGLPTQIPSEPEEDDANDPTDANDPEDSTTPDK